MDCIDLLAQLGALMISGYGNEVKYNMAIVQSIKFFHGTLFGCEVHIVLCVSSTNSRIISLGGQKSD